MVQFWNTGLYVLLIHCIKPKQIGFLRTNTTTQNITIERSEGLNNLFGCFQLGMEKTVIRTQLSHFMYLFIYIYFLDKPHGLWDPSSTPRD